MRQVQVGFTRDFAFTAAQAAEPLGERLEAMPPPVRRDALIHGNPIEPGARVFVAQAADPLPGPKEGFLDRVLGQRLVPKDQTGGPQELEAVSVNHLLECVPVAVPTPFDDASERRIHEHANRIDAESAVDGGTFRTPHADPPPQGGRDVAMVWREGIISSRSVAARRW